MPGGVFEVIFVLVCVGLFARLFSPPGAKRKENTPVQIANAHHWYSFVAMKYYALGRQEPELVIHKILGTK